MNSQSGDPFSTAEEYQFENGGNGPLRVPGFGGIPIGLEIDAPRRFAHGLNDWVQPLRLTAREIAMLRVMEALTDKPDWDTKIFDENIVSRWRFEALRLDCLSDKAWDWCLAELRDKAALFGETRRVKILDAGSAVVKSDGLNYIKIQSELKRQVESIIAETPESAKDWHPHSNNQVLDIVHPSLYPLAYGRTRVLTKGGKVGLKDFDVHYSRGSETAPTKHPFELMCERSGASDDEQANYQWTTFSGGSLEGEDDLAYCYSTKFQWLPCDVEFTGESPTSVRITSYINNLHPTQHKDLYTTIERVLSAVIEPWNDILQKAGGQGRVPMRIRTYGLEWPRQPQVWISQLEAMDEMDSADEAKMCDLRTSIEACGKGPRNPKQATNASVPGDDRWGCGFLERVETRWPIFKKFLHPDPGLSFTYDDWKSGTNTGAAIVAKDLSFADWVEPDHDHEYYPVSLQKDFQDKGLQVIVKIASTELNPANHEYPGGSWHVEGLLNEHIVATAIFYFDVENVTEARISFRQETLMDFREFAENQSEEHQALKEVFGIPEVEGWPELKGQQAVQELGSVATPEGRLLVFPNTLQHRIHPFKLEDESRPGHRRFIVLWLVDPNYRICSTANVPPQRHDWWAHEVQSKANLGRKGMPNELIEQVMGETGDWPMGQDEAERLRLELMAERTTALETAEEYFDVVNFCEH